MTHETLMRIATGGEGYADQVAFSARIMDTMFEAEQVRMQAIVVRQEVARTRAQTRRWLCRSLEGQA